VTTACEMAGSPSSAAGRDRAGAQILLDVFLVLGFSVLSTTAWFSAWPKGQPWQAVHTI
jgi:hypothetical protein